MQMEPSSKWVTTSRPRTQARLSTASRTGEFVANFKTAWESLLLIANGHETKRAKPGARVDRAKLRQLDLHWHDLHHEGACRLLAEPVDIRTIQLTRGHAYRRLSGRNPGHSPACELIPVHVRWRFQSRAAAKETVRLTIRRKLVDSMRASWPGNVRL